MSSAASSVTTVAPYSLSIEVADSDIDALGHASNIAYLRWIQDAAVTHSAVLGFDLEAYQRLGGVFIVRRHEVDYLRPVLRGEVLEVRTWLCSVTTAKCVRATEILAAGGAVAARSQTTWGYVDLATGRAARIPEPVRRAFGATDL